MLILLFIFVLVLVVFFLFLNISPSSADMTYTFEVQKGWGVNRIAKELKARNIIRSATFLKVIAYLLMGYKSFQEGEYSISGSWTTFTIYKRLLRGGSIVKIYVTIPEGLTSRKIAMKLKSSGLLTEEVSFLSLIKDKDFIKEFGFNYDSLEGFLFPDTYQFFKGMYLRDIIKAMVLNFKKKLLDENIDRTNYDDKDFYHRIIMASIVEREYRQPDEASKIASVFYNRRKINMALQSCATIEYIITEELLKPHPRRLLYSDLEVKSSYNTYRNNGYPPSPISNPGIVALKAAFYPANTNYLYFVLKNIKEGTHEFSSQYSVHLASKLYLKNFLSKN